MGILKRDGSKIRTFYLQDVIVSEIWPYLANLYLDLMPQDKRIETCDFITLYTI